MNNKENGNGCQKGWRKNRYDVCGNKVTETKIDGGTLVCCGPDVELVSSEGRKERASGK